jgi:hypothetical protein
VRKFYSKNFVFGLKIILKSVADNRTTFIFNKLANETFGGVFLNIFYQPLQFSDRLKGGFVNIQLGLSFNDRILINRKRYNRKL